MDTKPEFDNFCERIDKKEPFSHIRFGDGEMIALIGNNPNFINCDNDRCSASLNRQITKIVTEPVLAQNFLYGLAPHVSQIGGNLVEECKRKPKKKGQIRKWHDGIKWQSATIFIDANRNGYMDRFFSLLDKNKTCLVANKKLHKMKFKFDYYIEAPEVATWEAKGEEILKQIKLNSVKNISPVIFLFCIGMSSLPIIYYSYKSIGEKDYLLDIGSAFDPYIQDGRFREWMLEMPNQTEVTNQIVKEKLKT